MKPRLDFWSNEWAREAVVRAQTWRLASTVVMGTNPLAESSIRVMRAMMRQNALDAVSRAKGVFKLKEAV